MSDDGLLPDLLYARAETASLGEPYHDAVATTRSPRGERGER